MTYKEALEQIKQYLDDPYRNYYEQDDLVDRIEKVIEEVFNDTNHT